MLTRGASDARRNRRDDKVTPFHAALPLEHSRGRYLIVIARLSVTFIMQISIQTRSGRALSRVSACDIAFDRSCLRSFKSLPIGDPSRSRVSSAADKSRLDGVGARASEISLVAGSGAREWMLVGPPPHCATPTISPPRAHKRHPCNSPWQETALPPRESLYAQLRELRRVGTT